MRNVPDALHRRLKAKAALEGVSLSDYILVELRRVAERPTRREMLDRLGARARSDLRPSPAEMIRQERDSR